MLRENTKIWFSSNSQIDLIKSLECSKTLYASQYALYLLYSFIFFLQIFISSF